MFLERREEGKLHKGSVLVGYDLGDQYSQISYCVFGNEDVETVATVVGTKQYNIPTVLCKRKGVNQWFYGKDAVKRKTCFLWKISCPQREKGRKSNLMKNPTILWR